jgi:putative ABC transport system permease protein
VPLFAKVRSSLRNLFSRRKAETELAEELHSHLALLIEEKIRDGMSQDDAQRAARIELGGIEQVKEQVREERVGNWLHSIVTDCRFALRQLRKNPGFTAIAVLTLALGVGANAALFTVIENILLRPLPYADSSRLVSIAPRTDKLQFANTSWRNYLDIRDQSHTFEAFGAYVPDVAVIQTKEASTAASAVRVTPSVFPMLGVSPLLGRVFSEEEGRVGGPAAVILSEGLWRRTFRADPDVIGRAVRIAGVSHTVIGVMPRSMTFPEEVGPDLQNGMWMPLQPTPEMLKERGYNFTAIVGRLRPGATANQAQTDLDIVAQHIRHDDPDGVHSDFGFRATPYLQLLTVQVRPVLLALLGALGLVLLIACANVANLLIARCLGRQQEFAVRAALGASRSRLIRQLLGEGALLSLLGSALGFLLAELALAGIRRLPEGTIPRGDSIAIHAPLVFALAAIATLTTLLSSLLPALLVARSDPQAGLQASTRSLGSHSVRRRLSGSLVAGEVALSTVLLISTGLLFRTLWNLEHSQLGFGVTHVTTFSAMSADSGGFVSMAVSEDNSNAPTSIATLVYEPVLERVRHIPGVEGAALISTPPLFGNDLHSSFDIVGRPKDPANTPSARVTAVSGEYARAMSTPVLRGRMIEENDSATAPPVIVVNEALAKKYFPNTDPLQQQIDFGGKETGMLKPFTIVGVLGNQVDSNVGGTPDPMIYLPYSQVPVTSLYYQALISTMVNFVVKTRGELPVASTMRSVFHEAAPNLALDNFKTMQEVVDENIFNQRLGLYLTAAFAGLAVLMVMAGLYGVLAQLVNYRRREIGIRMALGATRPGVARMILRQGAVLIGAGLASGILLALAASQVLSSFLYYVRSTDLLTYAAVAIGLFAIGLIASLLPAHKAASIEPMQALRED